MWVLYEDNHLLVVNKPAGLPTQGAAAGDDSLVVQAKDYLKQKFHKPGNAYVGVVSRLDALVSGVVVLARTSKGAARLSEQFREGEVEKIYWAVVEGSPPAATGELIDWLWKDEPQHKVVVIPREGPRPKDAQEARLHYRTLSKLDHGRTLLEVQLETGRKHQIRVQLAHCGMPILGDAKYGARERFPIGIALHARRLRLTHPTLKTSLDFLAHLPASWRSVGLDDERAVW
jgi:23S rRNA pseudouridine1911/1915/1917 synthase